MDPALRYQHPLEMLEDLDLLANPDSLAAHARTPTTKIVDCRILPTEVPTGDAHGIAGSAEVSTESDTSLEAAPHGDQEATAFAPPPTPQTLPRELGLAAPLPARPRPGKLKTLRNWFATHRGAPLGIALALVLTLASAAAFSGMSLLGYHLDLSRIGWMEPPVGRATVRETPGSWSPGSSPAPQIEGRCRGEGIRPDGGSYLGTAVIERTGTHYRITWNLANQVFSGTGTLSGSALAVTWTGTAAAGTVTYTLHPNGALQCALAGGRGHETLTPTTP